MTLIDKSVQDLLEQAQVMNDPYSKQGAPTLALIAIGYALMGIKDELHEGNENLDNLRQALRNHK